MTHSYLKLASGLVALIGAVLPGRGEADEMTVRPLPHSDSGGIAWVERIDAVSVILDFAKILTFSMPAHTLIIGNPAVVDGTLSDEKTIVLTGKSIGTTNMIVLGEAGREIANLVVNVTTNNSQSVTVHQGEAQQTYTCAVTCRPPRTPTPDGK